MVGVIDVGGGERAVYGSGVFDTLIDQGITFDWYCGVSAGSPNVTSYMAGQRGRTRRFYTEYAFRPEYMSPHNFVHDGWYVDLDYIYSGIMNSTGEDPLDYPAMVASGGQLCIVTTDADTGKPVYLGMDDMSQDDYWPLKASSCLPIASKPYEHAGRRYFDGGVADPIPLGEAFRAGCDKVVVVLTRPRDFRRDPGKDRELARILARRYPKAGEALARRAVTYNAELDLAEFNAAQGRVLIVAPESIGNMRTLTKDKDEINRMYVRGLEDAKAVAAFLEA